MRLIDADAIKYTMLQKFVKGTLHEQQGIWKKDIDAQPTIDAVPVVRCANCTVQHNRWTGCPKLGGLIPPNDFYCGFGREDDADNG